MSEYLTGLLRRPPVGWWDLLDIAIVSIIFYEFLKLIRGTRAVQMAAGSLLLVGLFYVSRLAPLQTLNWMIRNMLVYVAFAAIVIFQSDIRRALAHFGQAPFFRYFNRQESANETIEELVVASTMLSSQRIGAIIAIEREIGLRNYIESGIPLDATLTYDLIVTIFQPKSPLHDGAVILQEDRIAAAACFLPLTVNPRVSRELGTRHRAAIGLTEENDAVAIVVSEERGQIALAINGRIDRGLSPDDLRERFEDVRRAAARQRRPVVCVRRLMAYHPFRHLGLKIVALACASLLWLTVAGEHVVERILRVPVEFRNIPAQLEVVGDPPENVEVRLRGSSALLSRLDAGEVVAVVDLQQARPGSRLFHIRNEEVRSPFGVEVAQVIPGTLGHRAGENAAPRGAGGGANRGRSGARLRGRSGDRGTRDGRDCGAGEPGEEAGQCHDRAGDRHRRAGQRARRRDGRRDSTPRCVWSSLRTSP